MAREQTAGRGQRGRSWYAPAGEALCVTYYLHEASLVPEQAGPLALLTGVVVAETLLTLLPASLRDLIRLKWPNDVLFEGKKVAGILVEMVKIANGAWIALVGVGVNLTVRAFPPEIAHTATALFHKGKAPAAEEVGERILEHLTQSTRRWREQGSAEVIQAWTRLDGTTGRRYEALSREGTRVEGIATGITSEGALVLSLANGHRIQVDTASALLDHTQYPLPNP